MIAENRDVDVFSVAARAQSAGRGTKGRQWFSADRNLSLTVVVKVSVIPISLTLVPLRYVKKVLLNIRTQLINLTNDK